MSASSFFKRGGRVALILLIEFLILQPLAVAIPQVLAASDSPDSISLPSRVSACENAPDTMDDTTTSGDTATDPSTSPDDYSDNDVQQGGVYLNSSNPYLTTLAGKNTVSSLLSQDAETLPNNQGWIVCESDIDNLFSLLPLSQDASQFLNLAQNPTLNKIGFTNPTDQYALTGEPCDPGSLTDNICDETKGEYDAHGKPILDANGKQVTTIDTGCNANGIPTYKAPTWRPLHYTDSPWPNDCWDAPKADVRILQTLNYLVTPVEEGGAGHEFIRVSSILEDNPQNLAEFPTPTPTSGSTPTTPSAENPDTLSAHYYDSSDPHHPSKLATAFDIDQIDKVRVTTKIIERKHGAELLGVGQDNVNFQFSSFPIDVAWQSPNGLATNPPPQPGDLYTGSLDTFGTSLNSLLTDLGLSSQAGSDLSLNNLGDVTSSIGKAALAQALGIPIDSLSGATVRERLVAIGEAFADKKLNLPSGSLAKGTLDRTLQSLSSGNGRTVADVAPSVPTTEELLIAAGQYQVEQELGLPVDSLDGVNSQEILQNVGRRYLEDTIFKVSEGALSGTISDQATLLQRLGAGRIERQYNFDPQSVQSLSTLDALAKLGDSSLNPFSSLGEEPAQTDQDLGLAFDPVQGSTKDQFGYTAGDFAHPTQDLLDKKIDLPTYERLVGSRVVGEGIGTFTPAATDAGGTSPIQPQLFNFLSFQTNNCSYETKLERNDNSVVATSNFVNQALSQLFAIPNNNHCPSTDTYYKEVTSSPGYQLLQQYQAFSAQDLDGLINNLISAYLNNTFVTTQPACQLSQDCLHQLHNSITSYWRPLIKQGLNALQAPEIALQNSEPDSDTTPTPYTGNEPDQVKNISNLVNSDSTQDQSTRQDAITLLNRLLSFVDSYDDGLGTLEQMGGGQSGRSLALGLPGTITQTSSDGSQSDTSLLGADPITQLLAGALTPDLEANLGRSVLAKQIAPQPMAQQLVAGSLVPNHDPGLTLFKNLPVDDTAMVSKGLLPGDFERIFVKDEGSAVFQRTGTLSLLNQQPNQPSQRVSSSSDGSESTTSSNTQGQINPTTLNASTDPSFYQSRLQKVLTFAQAHQDIAGLTTTLASFIGPDGKLISLSTTSPDALKQAASAFEAPIQALLECVDSSCSQAATQAVSISQTLQEIQAGQPLDPSSLTSDSLSSQPDSYSRRFSVTGTALAADNQGTLTPTVINGCGDGRDILSILKNVPNSQRSSVLNDYLLHLADCRVSTLLNLPVGTLQNWVELGEKHQDYGGQTLEIAAGYAAHNLDVLTAVGQNDTSLAAEGQTLITSRAISALASHVPSFSSAILRYGLSSDDLSSLLEGRPGKLATKVGEALVDTHFHWTQGTTANLVNPTCMVAGTTQTRPCSAAEIAQTRNKTMLSLGLASLGKALNFPPGFDPTSGNLLTSYGVAYLAQKLHLPVSQVVGTFSDIRKVASKQSIANALGLYGNPFIAQIQQTEQAQVSDSTIQAQEIVKTTKQLLDQASEDLFDSMLSDLTNPTSPFWTPSTSATSVNTLVTKYASVYTQDLNQATEKLQAQFGSGAASYIKQLQDDSAKVNALITQHLQEFSQEITSFQNTILSIQKDIGLTTANLDLTKTILGQLITNPTLSLNSLASEIGNQQLLGTSGKLLSNYLTGNNNPLKDDPYFKDLLSVFPNLDQTLATCANKEVSSLANLSNSQTNPPNPCTSYVNFFTSAFGNNLEREFNLPSGTMRAFLADPARGKSVAISAGIDMLVEAIDPNTTKNDLVDNLRHALSSSLMLGYYDASNPYFTLGLVSPTNLALGNLTASLVNLSKDEVTNLETQLKNAHIANLGGLQISGADLLSLLSGNTTTFAATALQHYVTQLDLSITQNLDVPDPGNRNRFFAFSFTDVRTFLGLPVSQSELSQAGATSELAYATSQVASLPTNDPCKSLTGSTLTTCFLTKHPEQTLNMQFANKEGQTNYRQESRQQAGDNLRYKALDLAAYKFDHNIPPGFAKTMLVGNSSQKIAALGSFMMTSIGVNKILESFITSHPGTAEAVKKFEADLTTFISQGMKDGKISSTDLSNDLQSGAEDVVNGWVSADLNGQFGFKLPTGFTSDLINWGKTGFDNNSFRASFANVKVDGIPLNASWTQTKDALTAQAFTFADRHLGFKSGSTASLFNAGKKFYQSADLFAKGKIGAAKLSGAAVDFGLAIAQIFFSKEIAEFEHSLGLPAGTISMVIGAIANVLQGNLLQAGLDLVMAAVNLLTGVYRTDTIITASADGHYPQHPDHTADEGFNCDSLPENNWHDGKQSCLNYHPPKDEYDSPDITTGEFSATDPTAYNQGLMAAAQAKVQGTLADLASMADSNWPTIVGATPTKLWPSQVFTYDQKDLDNIAYIIDRPAPWDNPPGLGYGPLSERAVITQGANGLEAKPLSNFRAGFFASPAFANNIHIRW